MKEGDKKIVRYRTYSITCVYLKCKKCGNFWWKRLGDCNKKTFTGLCRKCNIQTFLRYGASSKNGHWTGGVHKSFGYIYIWVDPSDPLHSMANPDNYVKRCRIVMAKHIGRCLSLEEVIHHKNGDKTDDRIENLQLTNQEEHSRNHMLSRWEKRKARKCC